jgi:adenosylcobinamide-phosphate synthase
MTLTLLAILLAVLLDRFLPDRGSFPVWEYYSDWVESIEQRFNAGARSQGVSGVVVATVPLSAAIFLAWYLLSQMSGLLVFIFDVGVLYLCLDLYRLGATTEAVANALESNDLATAKVNLQVLTGKVTAEQSEAGIAHATVEAVLKLANTWVMSPLFWFVLLGPVGVALQRMFAVLDRLWGHRDERYAEFGWAAARLDDLLNWVPARITALSYAIMGSFEDALHCWRRSAGMWSDINSGPLLASGMGAMHLDVCDDGEREDVYGNRVITPTLLPDAGHVRRVMALVWRVLLFWLAVDVLMVGAHLFGLLMR